MDSARWATALRRRPDQASQDCAAAVDRGADPEMHPGSATTANLLVIYRRRAAHVLAVGLEHGGFDLTVHDLTSCGHEKLRLAGITDRDRRRHYLVFLAPDSDDVVACLWVRDPV